MPLLLASLFIYFQIPIFFKETQSPEMEDEDEEDKSEEVKVGEEEEEEDSGEENGDDEDDDGDDAYEIEDEEDEELKQPPKKITKNVRGKIREYYFVETVKSMKELDKFRLKVKQNNEDIFKSFEL
jgi:hypothetical protein